MSGSAGMARPLIEAARAIEAEVGHWPGVSFEFERRSKHCAVRLRSPAGSVTVTVSATPGDRRWMANTISDVRRGLRSIGARRK